MYNSKKAMARYTQQDRKRTEKKERKKERKKLAFFRIHNNPSCRSDFKGILDNRIEGNLPAILVNGLSVLVVKGVSGSQ